MASKIIVHQFPFPEYSTSVLFELHLFFLQVKFK